MLQYEWYSIGARRKNGGSYAQGIGAPLDNAQMEQDIGNIHGLQLFQAVGYDVIEEDGRTGILVTANARSWQSNYLQAGIEMSSDIDVDNSYKRY